MAAGAGDYDYECMRAELLGHEKPDYESFCKERQSVEEEDRQIEEAKEVEETKESLSGVSGRLHELNNILGRTQAKLNRIRLFSLGTFLKSHTESSAATPLETAVIEEEEHATDPKTLDGATNRLDAILEQAERAHYKMEDQRKQMRRFMR